MNTTKSLVFAMSVLLLATLATTNLSNSAVAEESAEVPSATTDIGTFADANETTTVGVQLTEAPPAAAEEQTVPSTEVPATPSSVAEERLEQLQEKLDELRFLEMRSLPIGTDINWVNPQLGENGWSEWVSIPQVYSEDADLDVGIASYWSEVLVCFSYSNEKPDEMSLGDNCDDPEKGEFQPRVGWEYHEVCDSCGNWVRVYVADCDIPDLTILWLIQE